LNKDINEGIQQDFSIISKDITNLFYSSKSYSDENLFGLVKSLIQLSTDSLSNIIISNDSQVIYFIYLAGFILHLNVD
jgi:hypothetical protein